MVKRHKHQQNNFYRKNEPHNPDTRYKPAIQETEGARLIPLQGGLPDEKDTAVSDKIPAGTISQKQNEEDVVKALYAGIIKYAKLHKFSLAERLRKKLIEIAPMALTEIVQSSEIMEQEQIAAMDPSKMTPFADFFRTLTKSESTAFYFALDEFQAKANQPVFEQCGFDHRLYFIQSGRLVLSYYDTENKQNIDFAILQKGDIAGEDAFLSLTGHSTTLTPIVDSHISYITKGAFDHIAIEHPAFAAKLAKFCESRKKDCRIDGSKRQARRRFRRYPVSIIAQVRKIDIQGKIEDESLAVRLADISSGGLCYIMKNVNASEAESLYKKFVLIQAPYEVGESVKELKKVAKVVSVKFLPFDECSIHVKFNKPIHENRLLEIINHSKTI